MQSETKIDVETKPATDVKSTPENKKYNKPSGVWTYLGRPLSRFGAMIATVALSVGAVIPLAIKASANLLNAVFTANAGSAKELVKNIGSIVAIPLGGIISMFSIPVGGNLVKLIVLPAGIHFNRYIKVPANKRSFKDEVGPQKTNPEINSVFINENKSITEIALPILRVYPVIKTHNNKFVDAATVMREQKGGIPDTTPKHRLLFNANGHFYQLGFLSIEQDTQEMKCHTHTFNYPTVTKPGNFSSIYDLVYYGILQVYYLAEVNKWSDQELEEYLYLNGHSLGGAIALQVAAYFKKHHGINFIVFVDRSFSSLSLTFAAHIHDYTGLPLWYAKLLSATMLFAGGELDLDSIAATKILDPKKIIFINIGHIKPLPKPENTFQKVKKYFGIGEPEPNADPFVPDIATYAYGVRSAKINCGASTCDIMGALSSHPNLVYSHTKPELAHSKSIRDLYVDSDQPRQKRTVFEFHQRAVLKDETPTHERKLSAASETSIQCWF